MKKLVLVIAFTIFIVGCNGVITNKEKINVSELIEKGRIEIAGNSFEVSHPSVVSYKYDGSNVVERLDNNAKILSFYDGDLLYKHEGYSTGSGRLLWTYLYTYDDEGKEIRKETVIGQTRDWMNQLTSYENNYKEISYYDQEGVISRVSEFDLNNE